MQIVSLGDNLHEMSKPSVSLGDNLHNMSKPIFCGKIRKTIQEVVCWNIYPAC